MPEVVHGDVPQARLLKAAQQLNLAIIAPDEPTHYWAGGSSTIDLALTKEVNLQAISVLEELDSDHRPVVFQTEGLKIQNKTQKHYKNYDKADWPGFKSYLKDNLKPNTKITTKEEIDNEVKRITDTIQHAATIYIPKLSQKDADKPTAIVRRLMSERNATRRRWQKQPTDANKLALDIAKEKLNKKIIEEYEEKWLTNVKKAEKNNNYIWKNIKFAKTGNTNQIISIQDSDGTRHYEDSAKANLPNN